MEPHSEENKIWLSIHPRNFASHVTVRQSDRPHRQSEILHCTANVEAFKLISRAQVSTHRGYVFCEVIHRQVARLEMIAGSTPRGFLWDGYYDAP